MSDTKPVLAPRGAGAELPLQAPAFAGQIGDTAAQSTAQRPFVPRPAAGAPNVLVILLDDVGFAQFGTFGGAVPTPALDGLAARGLRYNRYHTTALCSPTRAAMLTGRNHHVSGYGTVTEYSSGFPGYNASWPRSVGCIAEILRLHGYATAALGKWHNTPNWESGPSGPFDRWPTGQGFEYFYGFLGGATSQWEPTLYENTRPVVRTTPRHEFHLTTELADKAIQWIGTTRAMAPDRPFFLWLAPGATHAPHHAPDEFIKLFEGQFDGGWDLYRDQAFARQRALGVIPADAVLTPRPEGLPAWDSLTSPQQRLYARMMEVFAGFTAHTDHEIGRVFEALRESGADENTLIVYSVGDNGASGEGGFEGIVNGMSYFNGQPESLQDMLAQMDRLGGPTLYNNFPVGWAWAMDTPFRWIKKAAGHLGGVRNPLVVSWPRRILDHGGLRSQFVHCVDVAPTVLEATGIPMPEMLHGQQQRPLDGKSFAYTFDHPDASERHTRQYFEALGNRGLYADGWWAGVLENLPWEPTKKLDLEASRWELYHLEQDFTQAHDLAQSQPQKLRDMKELFMREARDNQVLPLDTATNEKMLDAQALAGGPVVNCFTFFAGTVGLFEAAAPNTKNRSFRMTAEVVIPVDGAQGVLVAMGGRFGGYSLFVRDDRLHYWYNNSGIEQHHFSSQTTLPHGPRNLAIEFIYDGGGAGKGGEVRLLVDSQCVATGRLDRTVPRIFSRETFDVGMDLNSPVGDYEAPYAFTGVLKKLVVQLL
jgi:arylsulfatase A-like enzyme